MIRDSGGGGFAVSLPDAESVHDMRGLVHAILWDDSEGQRVILGNADLRTLCQLLAALVTSALLVTSKDQDDDRPIDLEHLTDEQRQGAEAALMVAITAFSDDLTGQE